AGLADGRDAAALDGIRRELLQARTRLRSLGTDYLRDAPRPQLAVLLHTIDSCEQLGDWPHVADLAARTLQRCGDDPDPAVRRLLDEQVRPKVGEALLRQGRCRAAYEALREVQQRCPDSPQVGRLICLCLGGWCSIDADGRCAVEPALGQPK